MTPWWLAWDTAIAVGLSAWSWRAWRLDSRRRALAAAKAEHMRLFDGEHYCCWVVDNEQCGLWCCHDGDHTADRIGDYLPMAMPIIHPLDMLRLQLTPWRWWRCPMCGTEPGDYGLGWVVKLEGVVGRGYGDALTCSTERHWRFEPCGCEGREILEEQYG